jgi:uncharacterized Zn finger protein
MGWGYDWRPYVPVAERRRKALQKVEKLKKKGQVISPVQIVGRTIAGTFWGKAWCDNLEAYSDYENRLPRGRTYVRNGSVIDLHIRKGQVEALVSGSELYSVQVRINPLPVLIWKTIQRDCSGRIASLVDLLKGRLSGAVMEIVTKKQTGLFPTPKEISFKCSCPDWAHMCKHVASVLYGIGARLDHAPELLFGLRGVDHGDLITAQTAAKTTVSAGVREKMIAEDQLSEIFGIDIDTGAKETPPPVKKRVGRPKTVPEKEKVAIKITKGAAVKKTTKTPVKTIAKTPVRKKAQAVAKKTAAKKPQPKPKKIAEPTVKKRVTAPAKQLPPPPKPVRGRKPKGGKVETRPKV